MTVRTLRAVATAFLLGAATVGSGAVVLSGPAYAAEVRPAIGNLLNAAMGLAKKSDWKGAMAKVNQAEAVPNRTAGENSVINQMKNYIAVKSGDVSIGGATAAKAKFADDYNARRYKAVIADGELLRKTNALDAKSKQLIAQAYYLSGDKTGCVKYIKSNFGSSANNTVLELQMRCAYDSGDEASQRQALETLVARTGKPEYWNSLLKLSERARGMRDHDTLDIYRLRMLTGTLNGKEDYNTLAQLAMQLGFPGEAVTVIKQGQAKVKAFNDDRTSRLLKLAETQAAKDKAGQAAALAKAQAGPNGDALIKIGEDQWANGDAKAAIATIQAGIKKGPTDKDDAQIRLGQAYLGAGQKAAAIKAFDSVKGPAASKQVMIAHLWSLYAHH